MSDPIISLPLAKDWITRLTQQLGKLTGARGKQLDELFFEFGDWRELKKCYIEPNCQLANPADFDEREPIPSFAHRAPMRDWLNRFLKKRFKNRNGHNTLFLLADAGMGKTSLLTMLKLTEIESFWPKELRFELLKLGPETLPRIQELRPQASRTVLLLDSLDEDRTAWGKVGERLEALLQEVTAFRFAIITCRTQYFPRPRGTAGPGHPSLAPGLFQLRGYECNLLYLSPFDADQTNAYLSQAYPESLAERAARWLLRRPDQREQLRGIVESMGDLSMRPLLLAHVEDLLEEEVEAGREFSVYSRLVDCWLNREIRKLAKAKINVEVEQLWAACTDLAMKQQQLGVRSLSQDALDEVLDEPSLRSALKSFKFGGRSLLNRNSQGEYRFAHYSIQEFLVARAILQGALPEDGRVRLTTQILTFLVSGHSEHSIRELPWGRFNLADVELAEVDLGHFKLVVDDASRAALFHEEADKRYDAYLEISSYLPDPYLALLFLDQQRRRTRDGNDLFHLELALEVIARFSPEARAWAEELSERFYDHIPAPPRILFEQVKTKDGVVDLWCEIPTGTYRLGSPKVEHVWEGERLPYDATVEFPFRLAAVPVTQAQYRSFDPDHASYFKGDLRPVEGVSWYAAVAFCRWLARQEETAGARLPTEEEWEIACRGGTETPYWSGNSEEDLGRVGWYKGNSKEKTHEVGEKVKNAWGLYDMHGNVWEWTQSPWAARQAHAQDDVLISSRTEGAESQLLPHVAAPDNASADLAEARRAHRVIRGGGYWITAGRARSAYRRRYDPRLRNWDLGFRVLLPSSGAAGLVPSPSGPPRPSSIVDL